MNITIVSTAYPLRGGIAHFVALLTKYLLKTNHKVNIFSFKRQYPKIFFPGKTQEESGEKISSQINSEMIVDSINPFNWIRVGNKIKKQKPELIIFKYWLPFFALCFGTISWFAKINKHTKVLVICDNIIPHEKRFGDKIFTKYFFSMCDFFIVQSDSVEIELNKFFPNSNYKKIAHPVYEIFGESVDKKIAREKLNITQEEKIILFFGYVRKYKGLDIAIESMQNVNNATLYVVGEFYDDKDFYISLAKKLNVGNKIVFISDYIANDEVKFYFSSCDVVLLPYKSATQSGIAQIAFNFNKPIIATNVGGLSEIIPNGKAGFIVEPNNAKEIANAINIFFKENKHVEFSKQIEIEKKKYSWENFVNEIENFR